MIMDQGRRTAKGCMPFPSSMETANEREWPED
jgi:hypothetical protein